MTGTDVVICVFLVCAAAGSIAWLAQQVLLMHIQLKHQQESRTHKLQVEIDDLNKQTTMMRNGTSSELDKIRERLTRMEMKRTS